MSQFKNQTPRENADTGDWVTAQAWLPDLPGYEILDEIGRGGMGVVYRARQISSNRIMALKMIRDSALASLHQLARFRIETEAAARMRHDHIVRIEEIGAHQGRPYLVMELIDGGRLDQYLAGKPQPCLFSADIVLALARAVQYAHEQKIVHRDLKPANVLLQKSDSKNLVPKITDFGLAKRLDSESTAWTPEGAIVGTPTYMAPEQVEGKGQNIGPAVDVYALGTILYEMLTGHPPFSADNWTVALQKILHEEPAPPTGLQADVANDLETICLKCLEKDPARRYASASHLAEDLERFLKKKPIKAVPPDATERLNKMAASEGYQILAEVGRGPHGIVYHARHEQFKQPVVLKIFRKGICTAEEWQSYLERESGLWGALAHPQVVSIQRGGWLDGAPYLASEYVPPGCLAARLNGGPLPVQQALGLARQIAEIFGYLHRQGMIHGNLKPTNVLMAANGIPRLTDFRWPRFLYQNSLAQAEGARYLPPEMLADPNTELRFDMDIYGLGVLLYEMLTGALPFAGEHPQEVLEQIRERAPSPPSAFNSEVTPALDRTCLRCLNKNHWRRYVRAYDLSMRLRRLMEE